MNRTIPCVTTIALLLAASLLAQTHPAGLGPKPPTTVEPLKGDWEQIDQRMVFLTTQLASVEASLDAVNKAMRMAGSQQVVKQSDADRYRKGNELMDRNLGMPSSIRWDQFYGKTADKFFYHPTDRNSTYHTETVLRQKPPTGDAAAGEGVPARQGLPVHQRPPQFDYIYRANADAQKRADAEAAKLAGKADALAARRRQLEGEQSALWCKIAFRAVAGRDLTSKPLYRFDLKAGDSGPLGVQRLEAMKGAMDFLRLANAMAEAADKGVDADQGRFMARLEGSVSAARKTLGRALGGAGVTRAGRGRPSHDRRQAGGRRQARGRRGEERG